eukprot:jgi/Ulvmu1/10742/UM068_0032.1
MTAAERAPFSSPLQLPAGGGGCVRMHDARREVKLAATGRVLSVAAAVRYGSVRLLRGYRDREWELSDRGAFALVVMQNIHALGGNAWPTAAAVALLRVAAVAARARLPQLTTAS